MSDNMIPELTLDPAAAAAPVPELTLEPAATPAALEPEKPEVKPVELDDSMLSEAEKKAVEDFSKKIDVMDSIFPTMQKQAMSAATIKSIGREGFITLRILSGSD